MNIIGLKAVVNKNYPEELARGYRGVIVAHGTDWIDVLFSNDRRERFHPHELDILVAGDEIVGYAST